MSRSMLPSLEYVQLRLAPLAYSCAVAMASIPAGLVSVMLPVAEHPKASVTVITYVPAPTPVRFCEIPSDPLGPVHEEE